MKSLVLLCALAVLSAAPAQAQQDRWFSRDKTLHLAAGGALGAGGYALGAVAFDTRGPRVAVGISIGLLGGMAKEVRDRRSVGTPSWRDFAWTAAGTALGVTAAWLVDGAGGARAAPPPSGEAATGQARSLTLAMSRWP